VHFLIFTGCILISPRFTRRSKIGRWPPPGLQCPFDTQIHLYRGYGFLFELPQAQIHVPPIH
jgi:hypothetical protein